MPRTGGDSHAASAEENVTAIVAAFNPASGSRNAHHTFSPQDPKLSAPTRAPASRTTDPPSADTTDGTARMTAAASIVSSANGTANPAAPGTESSRTSNAGPAGAGATARGARRPAKCTVTVESRSPSPPSFRTTKEGTAKADAGRFTNATRTSEEPSNASNAVTGTPRAGARAGATQASAPAKPSSSSSRLPNTGPRLPNRHHARDAGDARLSRCASSRRRPNKATVVPPAASATDGAAPETTGEKRGANDARRVVEKTNVSSRELLNAFVATAKDVRASKGGAFWSRDTTKARRVREGALVFVSTALVPALVPARALVRENENGASHVPETEETRRARAKTSSSNAQKSVVADDAYRASPPLPVFFPKTNGSLSSNRTKPRASANTSLPPA